MGRLASCSILALAGCTALNPAYSGSGSDSDSASGGASTTLDASTSRETSGTGASGEGTASGTGASGEATASGTGETAGKAFEFVDDEWRGEFALGEANGLAWTGETLALSGGVSTGRHRSRIMTIGDDLDWQWMTWVPRHPYGIPLPDEGESDVGYGGAQIDMTGIELLLHLDAGDAAIGALVEDHSGHDRHGFIEGGEVEYGPGIHRGALDNRTSRAWIELDPEAFEFGNADFTWTAWFRTDDCTDQGATVMALDSVVAGDLGPSIWLYCSLPSSCEPTQTGTQFIMSAQVQAEGGTGFLCGTTPVDDDRWHHVGLVRSGPENATVTLYVDGVVEDQRATFIGEVTPADETLFTVAGQPPDPMGYPGAGRHDEVAVWSRALDAEEMAALYHRGRRRLQFRVRACQRPDCSDDPPFAGPGGASSDPATDSAAWLPGDPIELEDLSGVAFQYEATFDAEDGVPSPELYEFRVVGRRP